MTFTFSSGSVYTLVQRVLPSGEVDAEFGSVLVPAERHLEVLTNWRLIPKIG